MYKNLGNNTVIKEKEIIGIFDIDNTTVSSRTRKFLEIAQKESNIILTSNELPKTFVVASSKKGEKKVYITQLSTATLSKRKLV